jgi:hypothetical protein
MAKILSSRNEVGFTEALQEFVFLVHDVLGKDIAPADTDELLMQQLDTSLVDLAIALDETSDKITSLSMDIIQLKIQASRLLGDIKMATAVLEALAHPPIDSAPFKKALQVLTREGDAVVTPLVTSDVDGHGYSGVEVDISFSEASLSEALRLAIQEYNSEAAQEVLLA